MNCGQKSSLHLLIILLAIIGVESSLFAFNLLNQSQMQSQDTTTDERLQQLQEDYDNLTDQYDDLQDSYDDLQWEYNVLQQEYEVEKCLHIGNSLTSYYDYLRLVIGPTGASDWRATPDEYWQLAA